MIVNKLKNINSKITWIIGYLLVLTVASMAILIITSVLVRNILGFSFQWIVDVNRLIFVWMCFLGLIYVNDKDILIRFDLIDHYFSPGVHKIVTIGRYVLSLFLFWIMVKAGLQVSQFARAQEFSTIPVSTCWLYLAVVTAGCLLIFQTLVKILEVLVSPSSLMQGEDSTLWERT